MDVRPTCFGESKVPFHSCYNASKQEHVNTLEFCECVFCQEGGGRIFSPHSGDLEPSEGMLYNIFSCFWSNWVLSSCLCPLLLLVGRGCHPATCCHVFQAAAQSHSPELCSLDYLQPGSFSARSSGWIAFPSF